MSLEISSIREPIAIPVIDHPLAEAETLTTEPILNVTVGPVRGSTELSVIIVPMEQPTPPPIIVQVPARIPVHYNLDETTDLLAYEFFGACLCLSMAGIAAYLTKEFASEPVHIVVTVAGVTLFSVVACYILRGMGDINAQINREMGSRHQEVSRTSRAIEQVFIHINESV